MSNEVTTTKPAALPAELNDMLMEDAGMGMSEVTRDDIAIPFLKVLQSLSDQLQKSKPEYIPGAEQGGIFNTVSGEVYNGDKGVVVIPVAFMKSHIEWKPRAAGGGLVNNYGNDASIVQQAKTNDQGRLVLPNGNELVVSANYYVYLYNEETGATERALLSMAGTHMKYSKKWMALITGLQLDRPDGKGKFTPAMFYRSYRLTTAAESNDKGTWYTWRIAPGNNTLDLPNGVSLYKEAREFNRAVMAGEIKTPEPEQPQSQSMGSASASGEEGLDDEIPF